MAGAVAGVVAFSIGGNIASNLLGVIGTGTDLGGKFGNNEVSGAIGTGVSTAGGAKDALSAAQDVMKVIRKPPPSVSTAASRPGLVGRAVARVTTSVASKFPRVANFVSKGTRFIGRLGGPIAIVSGGVGVVTGVVDMAQNWKSMSGDKRGLAIANVASSALTVAGGVAMLVPGGQLVGGVLLGVAGLITVGSIIYEHHKAIAKGVVTAAKAVANGVTTAAKAVASGVTTAAKAVANGVTTAAKAVASGVTTAANAVANGAKTVVNAVGDFFGKMGGK